MIIRCSHAGVLSIADLKAKFHPKNRNKHPEAQITRLAEILKYQGVRYPAKISNRSGNITSGHGRILAAEHNGWDVFPVDYQDYDSEEQEYADVQADNAIALWAELDFSGINADLPDLGPDFDIDMLGIKNFVLEPAEKAQLTDPDAVPDSAETRVKPGDVWRLGEHRLMCGDSTSVTDIDRLMPNERAVACVTDPPYSVGYENQSREVGRKTRKETGDSYKDPEDAGQFLKDLFATIPSDLVVMTYPVDKDFHDLSDATREWDMMYECVWVKNHFAYVLGKRYQQKHEPILIFRRKGGESTFNVPSDQSTIFEYDKPSKNPDHPTPKPVELYKKLVEYHSDQGNTIFEPFGGSGTTLIACEATGRIARVMEISPQYCDVILKRWEDFTGLTAERVDE
jgi:DNA modification methylase